MRILDVDTDRVLDTICLYLTPQEAERMLGALQDLMEDLPDGNLHHVHLNDADYQREITVTVYTEENMHQFDQRSRKLIREGT